MYRRLRLQLYARRCRLQRLVRAGHILDQPGRRSEGHPSAQGHVTRSPDGQKHLTRDVEADAPDDLEQSGPLRLQIGHPPRPAVVHPRRLVSRVGQGGL